MLTGGRTHVGATQEAQRGLTLLEVLVAVLVFAGLAAVTTRTMGLVLRVAAEQGRRATAAALAAQVLEDVRAGAEAQLAEAARRRGFDCLRDDGPRAFAAPYEAYGYTVTITGVRLDPAEALPDWLVPAPAAPCRPPPRAHDDLLRWISVQVTFRGRLLVETTSAMLRGRR